jgi:hypothetical protein
MPLTEVRSTENPYQYQEPRSKRGIFQKPFMTAFSTAEYNGIAAVDWLAVVHA